MCLLGITLEADVRDCVAWLKVAGLAVAADRRRDGKTLAKIPARMTMSAISSDFDRRLMMLSYSLTCSDV